MTQKYLFLLAVCLLIGNSLLAQKFTEHPDNEPRNKGNAIFGSITFGAALPGADMAKRFGLDQNFGAGVEYMTANSFFFGLEGYYLFGSTVKEDPLDILRTPEGDIIGNNLALAEVSLRERGLYLGGMIGKLFPFGETRSGIRVSLGAGVLRHKIRVQDDTQSVAEITGDYIKGYDRLTQGMALNQFIGWQHIGKTRRVNFMIGFEFNQGFTNTLRDWDFNDMRKLDDKRLDLRYGIRAAWTLPFYFTKGEDIYY